MLQFFMYKTFIISADITEFYINNISFTLFLYFCTNILILLSLTCQTAIFIICLKLILLLEIALDM